MYFRYEWMSNDQWELAISFIILSLCAFFLVCKVKLALQRSRLVLFCSYWILHENSSMSYLLGNWCYLVINQLFLSNLLWILLLEQAAPCWLDGSLQSFSRNVSERCKTMWWWLFWPILCSTKTSFISPVSVAF